MTTLPVLSRYPNRLFSQKRNRSLGSFCCAETPIEKMSKARHTRSDADILCMTIPSFDCPHLPSRGRSLCGKTCANGTLNRFSKYINFVKRCVDIGGDADAAKL